MTSRGLAMVTLVCVIVAVAAAFISKKPRAADCEMGAFGCGHAEQHEQYKDWKPKNGRGSYCNGDDCRPVRARVEWDGSWSVWVPEFKTWMPVPDFAVGGPDRFGDGRSHFCSSKSRCR